MSEGSSIISLFILKIEASALRPAESYLTNRGWKVGSAVHLRDALTYVIQNQPKYVMIPSDHSNKKVKNLPKLLIQAFPVRIIGYANTGTPTSIGSLREMGLEYNLFPPISGPAIERIVFKIIKEAEAQNELKNSEHGHRHSTLLHPDQKSGTSPYSFFPSGNSSSHSDQSTTTSYSSTNMQHSVDQAMAALHQLISSGGLDESDSFPFPTSEEPVHRQPHSPEDPSLSWTQAFEQEQIHPIKGHQRESLTPEDRKKLEEIENSLIIKGTQQALDESVTKFEGMQEIQEVEKSSQLACILLESSRFSGYLVAALGKNRRIDREFINMVKDRLLGFLKVHGEVIREEETIDVNIQEVEFNQWALEQAHFLRRSIHGGDEIAMAFFPTKETSIKLEESVSEKMVRMDMNDLVDNQPVAFDLYIYLPENNKYLLYTPQGRPIYSHQKTRLLEKGIAKMHLRKESAGNVKKYKAQNFLNQKIAEYQQKSQKKVSPEIN